MSDKDKAVALFADGASTAAVARALGISEYKAKKLKPETSQAEPEAAAPEMADGLVWPIALEVAQADLDNLVETLDPQDLHDAVMQMDDPDKAQILTFALQNRLRKLLEAPAQPKPE